MRDQELHKAEAYESVAEDWQSIRTPHRLRIVIEHMAKHLKKAGYTTAAKMWKKRAAEVEHVKLTKEQINMLLFQVCFELKQLFSQ